MNEEINFSNDNEIVELIKCPKIILSSLANAVEKNRNSNRRFNVVGKENEIRFSIFFTQSLVKLEEFSCGILCDRFQLYRVNGFHGTTRKGFYTIGHHEYPHAHLLTIEDIEKGNALFPSNIQDLRGRYENFEATQLFFFEECNITNFEKYFFELLQISLN